MPFNPKDLRRTKITIPLKQVMEDNPGALFPVIVELKRNQNIDLGRNWVMNQLMGAVKGSTEYYIFARLNADSINALVAADKDNSIHHVWPDFKIQA